MKESLSSIKHGLILLTVVIFPAFGYFVCRSTSMSTGGALVAVFCIFLFLASIARTDCWFERTRILQFKKRECIIIVLFFALLVFHSLIQIVFEPDLDLERLVKSFFLLVLYFFGSFCFALLISHTSPLKSSFAVKFVFCVLVISSIAGVFHFSPFVPTAIKPVLFFAEPSHFALSFLPFICCIAALENFKIKLTLIVLGYAIAFALKNFTLVIGVTLIAGLLIPWKKLLMFGTLGIAVVVLAPIDLTYYIERLDFSGDTQNRSAMVFLSGWERAYLNLKNTNGMGVGFQQFGIVGERGEMMESLKTLNGADLNLLDGGAVAPKIIGEFGLLGILLILCYLITFIKYAKRLHVFSNKNFANVDCRTVFFLSCFMMYSIDLFVRGVGYFSSSSFFFIASLLFMAMDLLKDKALSELATVNSFPPGILPESKAA